VDGIGEIVVEDRLALVEIAQPSNSPPSLAIIPFALASETLTFAVRLHDLFFMSGATPSGTRLVPA
jgi:hypothetical protein